MSGSEVVMAEVCVPDSSGPFGKRLDFESGIHIFRVPSQNDSIFRANFTFSGFEAKTTRFGGQKSHFGTLLVVPYCRGYPLVDSVWYFMHILCPKSAHLLKNPYIKLSGSEIPQVPALDESI